jgi:hypothetical protein
MKKILTFITIILCLTLLAGFNGIAGALDKTDPGEKMINVSQKQPLEKGAAVEEGAEIVDEADMQKEAAEKTETQEMAGESIKQMDEPKK